MSPPEIDVETLRAALAELEDAKHRLRRDNERQLDLMRGRVLEALIPVVDNLERTLAAAEGGSPVVDGLKMVHAQFLTALAPFGLERRSALGERFDPRRHDAVAVIPVDDHGKDGVVVSELEPAYVFGERIVRPARVQVGRAGVRAES